MKRAAAALALLAGCRGNQSALDPAGTHAAEIANLWWVFLAVCTIVWVVVVAFLLAAAFRRRHRDSPREDGEGERRAVRAVAAGGIATAMILLVLLYLSSTTGHALATSSEEPVARIEITGHQWWWEVTYEAFPQSGYFTTANEIRLPVGRPVELILKSADVIHSLWIPNLHGKRDLIPGYTGRLTLLAERAGTWTGQCAEFCGNQHARMRMTVTAMPEPEFRAWLGAQRQPARPPVTPLERTGQQVFMKSSCPLCHTISGTLAQGKVGPSLTHVASRPTIAAGTLPNTKGHLAGWITDSQRIKPGNYMPPNVFEPEELQALLAYLQSLK